MSNISVFSHGFSRKMKSHEQDGETLSRALIALLRDSLRRSCHGFAIFHSVSSGQPLPEAFGGRLPPRNGGQIGPPTPRANNSAREKDSTANAELLDDALVARLVGALEVIEQL